MPVHIVGESRLLRDMFLAICQSNNYRIGSCCDDLAALSGLGEEDLVLFYSHEIGSGLVEQLRRFKAQNMASLLILIMGQDCPLSLQSALSSYAEAVIPQRKSADALIAALRVVQSGYRIVPSDISAALHAAEVTAASEAQTGSAGPEEDSIRPDSRTDTGGPVSGPVGGRGHSTGRDEAGPGKVPDRTPDRTSNRGDAAAPEGGDLLTLERPRPVDPVATRIADWSQGSVREAALRGASIGAAAQSRRLRDLPASAAAHGLSGREWLILTKLIDGATNKSIANELGICEATVKVHLRTCFRKVGAKNRTQAAIWASEQISG
ncbi:response regulator transcription factor [Phaeobacter italicus]|uniref:response regulator transcription factor n=1 Tax=Phaeobacter italicus TaxID=481446 RepID=UPI00248D43AC|nr:helix-turn-helix transcriptional regulator [Phaeobacter italicus]